MEVDKEKWLDENADRLSRMERLDRLSMSSQNQLNVQQVPGSNPTSAQKYFVNIWLILWIKMAKMVIFRLKIA